MRGRHAFRIHANPAARQQDELEPFSKRFFESTFSSSAGREISEIHASESPKYASKYDIDNTKTVVTFGKNLEYGASVGMICILRETRPTQTALKIIIWVLSVSAKAITF